MADILKIAFCDPPPRLPEMGTQYREWKAKHEEFAEWRMRPRHYTPIDNRVVGEVAQRFQLGERFESSMKSSFVEIDDAIQRGSRSDKNWGDTYLRPDKHTLLPGG